MNKKLLYFIAFALVLSSVLAFDIARAKDGGDDNEDSDHQGQMTSMMGFNHQEDKGDMHEREVKDVGSTLEVHIFNNGSVLARGAKITGIDNGVISAETVLGGATLDWVINTDSAKYIRKFGGVSDVSELAVGDIISFHGMLIKTTSALTVNADTIKDWSIQRKEANFEGTVKSVDSGNKTFVLTSDDRGDITVMVGTSTVIKNGDTTGVFADIKVDAEVSARGVWNTLSNQLSATVVKIHSADSNSNDNEKEVLGGTLKSIAGTTIPTTLVMTTKDKDYTVKITADTAVLGKYWLKTDLTTFKVGDKIQAYGTKTDLTIDATVVRDLGPKI